MKNGKHIIVDIDETLAHTFSPEDEFENIISDLSEEEKKNIYTLKFSDSEVYAGYIRPYKDYFIDVIFSEFETVNVWSAGTYSYVHAMIDVLYPEGKKPNIILTRSDCNEMKIKSNTDVCRYKELEVIFNKNPNYNYNNTLIVDDRNDICGFNCLNNIRIPEFVMNIDNYKEAMNDNSLLHLANWFKSDEFRNANNVMNIKSKSPFPL